MAKVYIHPNDKSLIGKKLVTQYGISTITNVTKERVIFENDNGSENWTWIYPNRQWATFDLREPKENKAVKALSLEEGYRKLEKENDVLQNRLNELNELLDMLKKKSTDRGY